jgi:high-affinity Fe2+/Pb2+ permease
MCRIAYRPARHQAPTIRPARKTRDKQSNNILTAAFAAAVAAAAASTAISVAVFAVAFPFYGTINAVVASITSPLVAFAFPAAAYSWLHRSRSRQQACVRPPPR